MGLRKANAEVAQDVPQSEAKPIESGAAAAVARLKTARAANALPKSEGHSGYKQYDPTSVNDDKSRRILRQGVYQHVSISPSVAGMKWDGADQFVDLVSEIAEKLIKRIEGQ